MADKKFVWIKKRPYIFEMEVVMQAGETPDWNAEGGNIFYKNIGTDTYIVYSYQPVTRVYINDAGNPTEVLGVHLKKQQL